MPSWLLKLFHYFRLTNSTDEQVDQYIKLKEEFRCYENGINNVKRLFQKSADGYIRYDEIGIQERIVLMHMAEKGLVNKFYQVQGSDKIVNYPPSLKEFYDQIRNLKTPVFTMYKLKERSS